MQHKTSSILASQAAYAARPFAVRWCDSHFSGTSRFTTYDAAFEYVQDMWRLTRRNVANNRYQASALRASYLETPDGRVSLNYVLLCDDVSSYGTPT